MSNLARNPVEPSPVELSGELFPLDEQWDQMHLTDRLHLLRQRLNEAIGSEFIHRIAIASYEPEYGRLKTYSSAGHQPSPMDHYEAELSQVPTLARLAEEGRPRLVHDYIDHPSQQPHTAALRESGLRSGLILPLHLDGDFYGFAFFNSVEPSYFSGRVLGWLAPYADLVRMLAINSIRKTRTLRGAARTAMAFGRARDDETGAHLLRMGEYSRLIARGLTGPHKVTDEFVDMVYQFSPVHDIGKVAIPDSVLLKPGRLSDEEFAQIREHVPRGMAMVQQMADELDLREDHRTRVLSNIVAYHHERLDGSGYPIGVTGERIPLEGRIVAVADVFDALTTRRVYKPAWEVEDAARELRREVEANKLCGVCVEAFLNQREAIEQIRHRHGLE